MASERFGVQFKSSGGEVVGRGVPTSAVQNWANLANGSAAALMTPKQPTLRMVLLPFFQP